LNDVRASILQPQVAHLGGGEKLKINAHNREMIFSFQFLIALFTFSFLLFNLL